MTDRRITYLSAVAACLAFYGAYQKWFSWIVLLAVLFLPLFSLILSIVPMLRTKVKMTAPEKVRKGSRARLKLAVNCPGIHPPFACRITVHEMMNRQNRILSHGEPLPTEHCGALLVEADRAKVCDYLGLFSRKLKKIPPVLVRVMPDEVKMNLPPDLNRYMARAWKPKKGGGYAENHEIRPYRPGDSMNLVHWKLSAKADALMLREPMEPEQGMMLLTMDLQGTPTELDRKFSRLLCYGQHLIRHGAAFEVIALTGNGIETWFVREESEFSDCVDALLCTPFATEGSIRERKRTAVWQYHIGGEPDEA